MPAEPVSAKAIFDEAEETGDPEARRAYLERACAGGIELRRRCSLPRCRFDSARSIAGHTGTGS
jgi:hypothetical protein